jgi:hypothetical protein
MTANPLEIMLRWELVDVSPILISVENKYGALVTDTTSECYET